MLKIIKEEIEETKDSKIEEEDEQESKIKNNDSNGIDEIETPQIDKELEEELMTKACGDSINNLINISWDLISQINSVIATLDFDYKKDNKEDIKDILNSIIDDATVNVGMLHKALSIIDEKKSDLIADGESKAENIISK